MPIRTKRWCDPAEPSDGLRVLVCRYRPRALPKAKETWDIWMRDLGPSPALFNAFYGKGQAPITLDAYRERYLQEMKGEPAAKWIQDLKERVRGGQTVTLLCSKDCILLAACHRTLLAGLIQAELDR